MIGREEPERHWRRSDKCVAKYHLRLLPHSLVACLSSVESRTYIHLYWPMAYMACGMRRKLCTE